MLPQTHTTLGFCSLLHLFTGQVTFWGWGDVVKK